MWQFNLLSLHFTCKRTAWSYFHVIRTPTFASVLTQVHLSDWPCNWSRIWRSRNVKLGLNMLDFHIICGRDEVCTCLDPYQIHWRSYIPININHNYMHLLLLKRSELYCNKLSMPNIALFPKDLTLYYDTCNKTSWPLSKMPK